MIRLHRLRYSPYARKVQVLLEILAVPHEVVEVPYGNREELAQLTGGYVYVPVLETGTGAVITESRAICEWALRTFPNTLVPPGLEAAAWAFHDHVENTVEDVLFRLCSPAVRDAWPTAWERALYTLVKERRYGAGCVDAWRQEREALLTRARDLLAPTRTTLQRQPFVLGAAPTLADLALYGQWAMCDVAEPGLLLELDPVFVAHARRVEGLRPA